MKLNTYKSLLKSEAYGFYTYMSNKDFDDDTKNAFARSITSSDLISSIIRKNFDLRKKSDIKKSSILSSAVLLESVFKIDVTQKILNKIESSIDDLSIDIIHATRGDNIVSTVITFSLVNVLDILK